MFFRCYIIISYLSFKSLVSCRNGIYVNCVRNCYKLTIDIEYIAERQVTVLLKIKCSFNNLFRKSICAFPRMDSLTVLYIVSKYIFLRKLSHFTLSKRICTVTIA